MASEKTASGGVGFCSLLTILFVGLKLTHYIDWSWWWVLAPLWMSAALMAVALAAIAVGFCVVAVIRK